MAPSTRVVGIGNAWRKDDAAGLAAARRLRGALPAGVSVSVHEGDALSLLDEWPSSSATVIVVDATSSGSAPGTIRRYDALERPLPAAFSRWSTHASGVAEAVELARALGRLPARLIVFGIEGRDFTPGEGLSPEVEAAVDEVVARVAEEAMD